MGKKVADFPNVGVKNRGGNTRRGAAEDLKRYSKEFREIYFRVAKLGAPTAGER